MYITFEDAINDYLKFVKLKRKQTSYRNISNRINNHILPYFKNKNIYDFTTLDYLKWQSIINDKGFKFRYKQTLHRCFVTFLNYCIDFYELKNNVASKVGNFNNDDIEDSGNIWTLEDFKKFINVVDDPIYRTFFIFLFLTGVRLGEALALTFNDIDFINNKLSINKTATRFFNDDKRILNNPKSKSSNRIIIIDNNLRKELLLLKKYYKNKFGFYNDNFFIFGGLNIIPFSTVTRNKNKYCEIAKVKQIKIHEFRHSHACLLFQNDVPIDEISYRLGHSKISITTDVYLRFIPKNEKRVLQTLNSIKL